MNTISNFKELLENSSKLYAENTAFHVKENADEIARKITYKEFKSDVDSLGTILIEKLNLKNKKVVIISKNRYEWCVSYLAITCGTGTVVPLDRLLTTSEIYSSILRSKADAVIFSDEYTDIMMQIKKEGKSNLQSYVCFDSKEATTDILSFQKLKEEGLELLTSGNTKFINSEINNEEMNIMLFTSGTTSMSKAVMLSHRNITSNVIGLSKAVRLGTEDRLLSFLPLHHTFECTTTFLFGLYSGASIAFCDGLRYIAANLKEYNISLFFSVPAIVEGMYKKIIKSLEAAGQHDLIENLKNPETCKTIEQINENRKKYGSIVANISENIREIVCGAAAIDRETVIGFRNLGLFVVQGYGLTETSPVLAVETETALKPGSIGKALPGCTLEVVNKDATNMGELRAKGPNVMIGYYENEEATKEVLVGDWFYTGDLAYIDHEGFVFITGRQKNVLVLKNGKNVFPEELELLVNRIPFVSESMIYGKPEKDGNLRINAKIIYNKEYIVENFGVISEEEIRTKLFDEIKKINQTMPLYKYIRNFTISETPLIKTTTNKIKRYEELKTLI